MHGKKGRRGDRKIKAPLPSMGSELGSRVVVVGSSVLEVGSSVVVVGVGCLLLPWLFLLELMAR